LVEGEGLLFHRQSSLVHNGLAWHGCVGRKAFVVVCCGGVEGCGGWRGQGGIASHQQRLTIKRLVCRAWPCQTLACDGCAVKACTRQLVSIYGVWIDRRRRHSMRQPATPGPNHLGSMPRPPQGTHGQLSQKASGQQGGKRLLTGSQPDDGLVAEIAVVGKHRRRAEKFEVTDSQSWQKGGHDGGDGEPHACKARDCCCSVVST